MNTKNVNKLVIIPLVFILVLTLSITYALFTKDVNTNNRNITLSSINKYIGIYGPNKNNIELNKDYTFTIENRGSIGSGYEIYIESETNIDLSTITYQVTGDITASGNLSNSAIIYSALSSDDTKTITLRLTSTSTESYIGKIKVRYKDYIVNYDYTGTAQTFNAPAKGTYKMELWGAEGGDGTHNNYGGYTSGDIIVDAVRTYYVYVGQKGDQVRTTKYNGGAYGGTGGGPGNSGGGATDIRLSNGEWNNFDSLKSRIMVSAGGGGAAVGVYDDAGEKSAAGGLIGHQGGYYPYHTYVNQNGKGGSQTAGGAAGNNHFSSTGAVYSGTFGSGGNSENYSDGMGSGGGGGGYYGGGAGGGTRSGGSGQGGGGGSSFISGHSGCNAISNSSTSNSIVHTGQPNHYSGLIFTNTNMIDGLGHTWSNTDLGAKDNNLMPKPSGGYYAKGTGHTGNGYARITYIGN